LTESIPGRQDIFFHVGLSKAASTYLQKRVFPELKGIQYIHRNRYWKFQQIIEQSPGGRFLVSREAAERLEHRVLEFAGYEPTGKVILVLRRHDDWIASHYRRYVKNGGSFPLEKFLDQSTLLGNDWRKGGPCFKRMIEMIEIHFGSQPLVLFHEDLQQDRTGFMKQLAAFTDTSYDDEKIDHRPIHLSWSEKQLKLSRSVGRYVFRPTPSENPNRRFNRLRRRLRLWSCYFILGIAGLVPARYTNNEPLIPKELLEQIHRLYSKDWQTCRAYAEANNPET